MSFSLTFGFAQIIKKDPEKPIEFNGISEVLKPVFVKEDSYEVKPLKPGIAIQYFLPNDGVYTVFEDVNEADSIATKRLEEAANNGDESANELLKTMEYCNLYKLAEHLIDNTENVKAFNIVTATTCNKLNHETMGFDVTYCSKEYEHHENSDHLQVTNRKIHDAVIKANEAVSAQDKESAFKELAEVVRCNVIDQIAKGINSVAVRKGLREHLALNLQFNGTNYEVKEF